MMNSNSTDAACESGANEPVDADLTAEAIDSDSLSEEAIIELAKTTEGEVGDAIRQLLDDRDQIREDRLRALAEVSNNQRRAVENERRIEQAARASACRTVLPVLDQIGMALDQDLETLSAVQLAEGVSLIRDELIKALADMGVDWITPEVGDEFDPVRHEAMLRQASADVESNHIVAVMQAGYAMGEQVLRPAKVSIAS
jgi:molecular chaperone GrpE